MTPSFTLQPFPDPNTLCAAAVPLTREQICYTEVRTKDKYCSWYQLRRGDYFVVKNP